MNRKLHSWGLMMLTLLLSSTLVAGERQSVRTLEMEIQEVSATGTVVVQIRHSSSQSCKIWEESNSWGASRWRVLQIRNGAVSLHFQDPDKNFFKNTPQYREIPPGGQIVERLDLSSGDWRGLGSEKIHFERGDLVVVIYDVPFTPENLKLGVWYGVASTSRLLD